MLCRFMERGRSVKTSQNAGNYKSLFLEGESMNVSDICTSFNVFDSIICSEILSAWLDS